jgi:hypothetical protein
VPVYRTNKMCMSASRPSCQRDRLAELTAAAAGCIHVATCVTPGKCLPFSYVQGDSAGCRAWSVARLMADVTVWCGCCGKLLHDRHDLAVCVCCRKGGAQVFEALAAGSGFVRLHDSRQSLAVVNCRRAVFSSTYTPVLW